MPTSVTGQQLVEGVIYADSSGSPGRLLGATRQIVIGKHSAHPQNNPFTVNRHPAATTTTSSSTTTSSTTTTTM